MSSFWIITAIGDAAGCNRLFSWPVRNGPHSLKDRPHCYMEAALTAANVRRMPLAEFKSLAAIDRPQEHYLVPDQDAGFEPRG